MDESVKPYRIEIPDSALDDLKQRLVNTRWPERETPDDWSQGIPLAYMQEVVRYWASDYDWRRCETRVNSFPQFQTTLEGLGIHFFHIRSAHEEALPLVMTHGWPGSIIEFTKVIEPLTDPASYGGRGTDAFHVVCPSLPGYGFSDKPTEPGWTQERIARVWGKLMKRLGYDRYVAQGGDWGALVTTELALADPEHCAGIHLNMPIAVPDPETMNDMTPLEQAALESIEHYEKWDSGYSKQQSTRPQTIGYGLVDSPAGQAAWILEKFWAWTDCDGHPEKVLTRDELLDNVMFYWLPAAASSSARLYWESFKKVNLDVISIPVGCSIFPKEIFRCSRRWAEKRFTNLVHWNELDKGGHFAAFEQPDIFINELRTCFRHMR